MTGVDTELSTSQCQHPENIFELAGSYPLQGSRDAQALGMLFDIRHGMAKCSVPQQLSNKYGACVTSTSFEDYTLTSSGRMYHPILDAIEIPKAMRNRIYSLCIVLQEWQQTTSSKL